MDDHDIPAGALWGPQTQLAIGNFRISGRTVDAGVIRALARIKAAAATANGELGVLDPAKVEPIRAAALEIADGGHHDQFPVDVFQTGSGTSTNMNVNEVVARLAERRTGGTPAIHPNDDVNAGQSSNDTFPTAIHIAALQAIRQELVPALDTLAASLTAKSEEFADAVKAGRTHLMDATPVTLGQEFGGYASTARLAVDRLGDVLQRVAAVPLGGTAVGTGINTHPDFAPRVLRLVNAETGLDLRQPADRFEAQSTRDSLVELSGVLRTVAVGITKICNDLRWMASGPGAGLAELRLPTLQPGSSIMPGKVNPVMPEATLMVCAQVIGNDATVTMAGASGNFELNVMMPVIAANVLDSIHLLANTLPLLAERCVEGITADRERLRRQAQSSPAIATALNPVIGYERAARVVAHALATGTTIRAAVIELGLVDDGSIDLDVLDRLLDVDRMHTPPRAKGHPT